MADVKIDLKKTGGGPPENPALDSFDEVLLSITSKKTVFGLNSKYGGDVSSDEEDTEKDVHPQATKDVDIIYEFDNGLNNPVNDASEEGFIGGFMDKDEDEVSPIVTIMLH